MIRLGPIELRNPWILAPMAGVSEQPFRELAQELGASACPTELVSAAGLMRAQARTLRYLRHGAAEKPFVVQLFGGDPATMARAAELARTCGADAVDVNMGCPVPKVTKSGAGSALMCDAPRAAAIVRACRDASGLPVTAKLRSGWDAARITCVEMGLALRDAGVCALALHPRTRAQGYSGLADWTRVQALKRTVGSLPVIGNGDIDTPVTARRRMQETGCDAVMIGRAALGNPWIFQEFCGGPPPTPAERAALVLRHFEAHLAFHGGGPPAVRSFRRHLGWYSGGLAGSAAFRARVNRIETAGEVRDQAAAFFASASPDPARGRRDVDVDLRTALG